MPLVQVIEIKDDLGVDRRSHKDIEARLIAQGVTGIAKIGLAE